MLRSVKSFHLEKVRRHLLRNLICIFVPHRTQETSKENCDFETKINELESSNNKLRERLYKSDSKLLSATARVGELQSKNNESLYLCDHK